MPTTQIVTFSKGNTVFANADNAIQSLEVNIPAAELSAIKSLITEAESAGNLTQQKTLSADCTTATITRNWGDAGWTAYSALASQQASAKAGVEAAGWTVTIS